MKSLLRFYLMMLLASTFVLFLGAGCGAGSELDDPTEPEGVVESEESAYILGKWEVNDGRLGNKIFDFQEDGRLQIEDVASGEMIEMTYLFVAETSMILSGEEEINGAATVAFFENKMDVTITFDGDIFAELYVFTRVPEASN
ncbi:MAG: hypothetical protein DHS20C20_16390 [Ardenticatenaceae bacterium]|nr:MAG: hypothetical protein DHS20C20_16390 [Ardenticatenaceae bacterium]